MAQRRLAYPGTMLQSMELIKKNQGSYAGGMNSDFPAQELGPNEVAEFFNMYGIGKYAIGRTGSRKLSDLELPVLEIPCKAEKSGNVVFIHDYNPPDQKDGNYIVWSDGLRDQIHDVNYSTGRFTSPISGDQAYGEYSMQERIWGIHYNEAMQRVLVHTGTRLLYTTNEFGDYVSVPVVGESTVLAQSRSAFDDDYDEVFVYNDNGIFRVVFDENSAYCFKINDGQPQFRIYSDELLPPDTYGRNRIYTAMRIIGPGCLHGNRTTAGVEVQQETAPVHSDSNGKDTSADTFASPVGIGAKSYERLFGGYFTPDVATLKTIDDAGFSITINETGPRDVIFDLTDIVIFEDAAAVIQESLRRIIPLANCSVGSGLLGTSRLIIDGGVENKNTISYAGSPTNGTDVSATLWLTYATGARVDDAIIDAPDPVYGFYPESQKTTHFGIYGSEDTIHKTLPDGTIVANNPDLLVWEKDVPVVKAFRVTHITSVNYETTNGEKGFSVDDVGSYVRSREGLVHRITKLIDLDGNTSKHEVEASAAFDSEFFNETEAIAIGAKKINTGYQILNTVTLDSASALGFNLLSQSDVGKILFLEDGSIRHVLAVAEDGESCTVHEDIEFGNVSAMEAIAWDPILLKDAPSPGDNKRVVIDKTAGATGAFDITRVSGPEFTSADIGCFIYIFMGKTPYRGKIVGASSDLANVTYSDPNLSPDGSGLTAIVARNVDWLIDGSSDPLKDSGMPSRFFNDTVTDDTLASRADSPSFVLQSRFRIPLPSSSIAAIGQNFMFVSKNGIAYSDMPAAREYVVGFYHPTYQADSGIDDIVTHLKSYPDRMIAFGKKSTWGTNISALTNIKTLDIGESIFTVPSFSLIDQHGLIHVGSIQDIGVGQSIMICHDGGVRVFDGSQYSAANLAENRVWKALRTLHTQIMSNYDPHGGYTIFGSNIVSSDAYNAVNMTEGVCYRLAILSSQGWLWSKWGGEAMVSPYPNTGGIRVSNAVDMPIQVMLDERTGKWHQINTFSGPAGSGLEETFTDKDDTEILCSVKGSRHFGSKQTDLLEHMESHGDINAPVTANVFGEGTISIDATGLVVTLDGSTFPADIGLGYQIAIDTDGAIENRRVLTRDSDTQLTLYSASTKKDRTGMGFIVIGPTFRIGFTVTTNIYVDNNRVYSAKTVDQPVDGDYVYDRKINSKMIQNEYVMSTSYFTFGDSEVIYVVRDTAGHTAMENRDTTETGQQRLYGEGLLWLTRGR